MHPYAAARATVNISITIDTSSKNTLGAHLAPALDA
jgi:hypothetical protein